MLLQAALLIFAAISAAYQSSRIDAAVIDAATRSGQPANGVVPPKASYFHSEVRVTLWYALLFAPVLIVVALVLWTDRAARAFAVGASALSVLCCCGAGGWLWLADVPEELDDQLPAAFGDAYPAWVDVGSFGLVATPILPFIVVLLIVAERANAKGS